MKWQPNGNLTTLTVETRILGWGAETVDIPLPTDRLRVVDLIRAKVSAEWVEWERGARAVVGRESLEPESFTRPNEPDAIDASPDLEHAVHTALDGYRAGWYIVLVDGSEPGGLDSWLTLDDSSVVAFVRVYPLPGARVEGR